MKKQDDYLLTIFTPTYNQEKYIGECLLNIVNQKTNFKYRVIVADDCSTDNTRKIIKQFQKKYPTKVFSIFNEHNLGPMNNFVNNLNNIHTKYVALCDGDDYWCDNQKLQQQVNYLENHKDYSICFHQTRIFFENHEQPDVLHPLNIKEDLILEDLLKENMIPANTVVYKWKYQKKDSLINEFPKNIVPGDYYIHLMHASVGKIHYINRTMSCYRRHNEGMWWMSSQANMKYDFYNIYGEKYLNFFESVEKKLKLTEEPFKYVKNDIICNSLIAYTKKKQSNKLKKLYNERHIKYADTFNYAISNLTNKEKIYYYQITDFLLLLKRGTKKVIKKVLCVK